MIADRRARMIRVRGSILGRKEEISLKGAIFCHVARDAHKGQEREDITIGNQK